MTNGEQRARAAESKRGGARIFRRLVKFLSARGAAFVRRRRASADMFLYQFCPPLWRLFFGRPRRRGERFEEICENFDRPTPNPKDVLGLEGERVAFEYFRADPNCDVIACGVETRYCEIDLIFLDKKTRELTFVEVKTRRRENARYPTIGAVDARRRKKLALAGNFFARQTGRHLYPLRFDVVVVIWPFGEEPRIKHYRDYFQYEAALDGYRGVRFGRRVSRKTKNQEDPPK